MRIGLIGFGKAGKAVANVILQNPEFSLEWVLRSSRNMENTSVKEWPMVALFTGASNWKQASLLETTNLQGRQDK